MYTKPAHFRGVTLVEVVISLAISALLLTAMALTVNAAIKTYAVNERYGTLTVNGRRAMTRMATLSSYASDEELFDEAKKNAFKTGGEVDPKSGKKVPYVKDTGFRLGVKNKKKERDCHEFKWDKTKGQLLTWRHPEKDNKEKWAVLASGVANFEVAMSCMQSEESKKSHGEGANFDTAKEITVSMTLSSALAEGQPAGGESDIQVTFVASIVPRRSVWNGPQLPLPLEVFTSP